MEMKNFPLKRIEETSSVRNNDKFYYVWRTFQMTDYDFFQLLTHVRYNYKLFTQRNLRSTYSTLRPMMKTLILVIHENK